MMHGTRQMTGRLNLTHAPGSLAQLAQGQTTLLFVRYSHMQLLSIISDHVMIQLVHTQSLSDCHWQSINYGLLSYTLCAGSTET
jgi:hypothetical protein